MSTIERSARPWTYAGLAIALLGLPAIVFAYRILGGTPADTGGVVLRELAILALVALLFWIILKRERLPLSSIGLRREGLGRSLGWGLALALALGAGLAACMVAFHFLGVHYGTGSGPIAVSMAATLLTVIRAGIAEEVFYRGYAIERIQALTGSKWLAALIPLACFAAFHYRHGWPGIALALVLGGILTAFYLWKRNLVAAIFAHFLIDFIPNVLLPLISGD
jgi:membrane protease YdiL (CAAX protease family)